MKATSYWSYFVSILVSAILGAFSGIAVGGQGVPVSSSIGATTILAQADDQDPNTPPDCKKFPRDTRCGGKK